MALKDRISRIETNPQVSPQLGAAAWWDELLAKPKENEHRINAAVMLAYDCLIQMPPPQVWSGIEATFRQDFDKLTDSQFAFGLFFALRGYEDADKEQAQAEFQEMFGDDEGKEWLCHMATVYLRTFKTAPLIPNPRLEKDGPGRVRVVALANLRHDFLIPLFQMIFPDEGAHRYGRFEEWLEKDGECESLLADLRAFMGIAQGVAA